MSKGMNKDVVIRMLTGLVYEVVREDPGGENYASKLFNRINQLEVSVMATVQEFKDQIMASLETVRGVIETEKAEVAAAVSALSAQVQALQDQIAAGDVIPADALAEVQASISDLAAQVQQIQT